MGKQSKEKAARRARQLEGREERRERSAASRVSVARMAFTWVLERGALHYLHFLRVNER